ncbi:Put7p [Rhodotorula paludigena]|uniref:Put7p n=1 Tax=Rhodotorula paludigena TaxID=86838 RepID=UPI003174DC74
MTSRTLCTSPFRSLALGRPRAYISTYAPLRANGPDPQDSHGSVPSSRRLRPRDRLQFTEASEREQSKDATSERDRSPEVQAGSSAGPSALPPVQDPPAPVNSEGGELVISAPLSDLPPLHSHHIPLSRVPFSTHRFVRDLEHAEVPRQLATDLMNATRDLLLREEERAQQELLNRQDLENEAYLFTAALSELKTGSQVKSRNDSITLRSLTASLQRETDGLEQKMKEDMQRLSSDIQLEMNARKEETGTELQTLDKKVMDLNSKFTILLSEVRTEIESTKWISTRRVMTAITVLVVSIVAYFSASSSKSRQAENPPSIDELGLQLPSGSSAEEAEMLSEGGPTSSRGWAFWTPQSIAGPKGRRVGAEDDEGTTS